MRTGYTGHITTSEWRWVTSFSILLVLGAFLPFLWMLVIGLTDSDWQFMGALHDYGNSATHLARIYQGTEDRWLLSYLHTPEAQDGTLIGFVYVLLGQLSRLVSLPAVVVFHIARIGASLFMYIALYQLAASIWMRVRTRRIFFVLIALGSGFGWLAAPLFQILDATDLIVPQAYPFLASLTNVHFPLAIACLALLSSVAVAVLRPGTHDRPAIENGGALVFTTSLILTFIYPEAVVPILLAFVLAAGIAWFQHRDNPSTKLLWLIWFAVPALPMTAYYLGVIAYNDVANAVWTQVLDTRSPSVIGLLAGFGLMLLVALPGLARATRRFEPDGDQFMLIWLIIIVILTYLPGIQAMALAGAMIPLAYFATRSVEDFWFEYIHRRQRMRVAVALLPILAASHLFMMWLPIRPMADGDFADASGLLLQEDYFNAFNWMERLVRHDDVVLAAPKVGLWLPVWTGGHVVYGHPIETIDADTREATVTQWYSTDDLDVCRDILNGTFNADTALYAVDYVLYGPMERALGDTVCLELLQPIQQVDDVVIFRYAPTATAFDPTDALP